MQPNVVAGVEKLTWSEACKRHPDEWVVAVEMECDDESYDPFVTAVVFAHHARRADASVSVKAALRTYDEVGSFWTGRRRIWPSTRLAAR